MRIAFSYGVIAIFEMYVWLFICKNIDSKTLFGLLNRLATFFGISYKIMNICTSDNTKIQQNWTR